MNIAEFFMLAMTFGPAAAIPYGLGFIDPTIIFITLLICYTLPVPAILHILEKFEKKEDYDNRIINEAVFLTKKQIFDLRKMSDQVTKVFHDWWGDLGYDLALAFLSFVMGFLWGAFIAFIMRIPKRRAYIAIFFGNIFGLIFWFAVAIGTIEIFDTSFFIIFIMFMTFYSYVYGRLREKRIIPIIIKKLEKEFGGSKKKKRR